MKPSMIASKTFCIPCGILRIFRVAKKAIVINTIITSQVVSKALVTGRKPNKVKTFSAAMDTG
jgi:hypothetical protein